ncbi:hypothetical protein IJ118_03040, partial [Candidatus Saccharibacteria bacterium]|nr:hypothetical protein [Candidatus Saccharibacteria bacterium]
MVTAKKEDFNKKEVREILNDGTPKGHNSRGRFRSQAERSESYRKYRELKRRVFEFEMKNHGV